jgi:hypothetical protein
MLQGKPPQPKPLRHKWESNALRDRPGMTIGFDLPPVEFVRGFVTISMLAIDIEMAMVDAAVQED